MAMPSARQLRARSLMACQVCATPTCASATSLMRAFSRILTATWHPVGTWTASFTLPNVPCPSVCWSM